MRFQASNMVFKLCGILCFLGWAVDALPPEDGLYAVFTLSRSNEASGVFSCKLEFEKVPRTVANFVGLAEGSQGWLDAAQGRVRFDPFYEGITFHRVVSNFVVQAGSPNGTGNDGPGYRFEDEFDTNLVHDVAGILSMANSGPDSNGSQFFITIANGTASHLNGIHSVFGRVVEGLPVVQTIRQGDVIDSVEIVRQGVVAQAFDASSHALPVWQAVEASLVPIADSLSLIYPRSAFVQNNVLFSTNLVHWTPWVGGDLPNPFSSQVRLPVAAVVSGSRAFFQVVQARARFSGPILAPSVIIPRRVNLVDTRGFSFTLDCVSNQAGSYRTTIDSSFIGEIVSIQWDPEDYRAGLVLGFGGGNYLFYQGREVLQAVIKLDFTSETAGAFEGVLINLNGVQFPMQGSFLLEDLP